MGDSNHSYSEVNVDREALRARVPIRCIGETDYPQKPCFLPEQSNSRHSRLDSPTRAFVGCSNKKDGFDILLKSGAQTTRFQFC
jgi:hypothetical protein